MKNKQKPCRAAIKVAPVQFFSPCSVYLRYVSIKDKDLDKPIKYCRNIKISLQGQSNTLKFIW